LIILSTSCRKTGIYLIEIITIMAMSSTGTRKILKGERSRKTPFANSLGEVVRVRIEEKIMDNAT
jgi:hypothetical protein